MSLQSLACEAERGYRVGRGGAARVCVPSVPQLREAGKRARFGKRTTVRSFSVTNDRSCYFQKVSKAPRTRQRILEHAVELASQLGVEGLTLGRLAEELGLSKSGLYAHFGSKEDLQIRILEAAAQRFIDVVVRPALKEPRGAPRVRALFEHWLRWASDEGRAGGCVFVAAATELDDRSGPARDALEASQRDWLTTLACACRIAQEEGHYRRDLDPDQVAFELQGILLAFHHRARLLRASDAVERARRAFLDLECRLR